VEGKITAAYGEFFNVLYVQDDTGGITVHAPAGDIDPSQFTRGTKVRVVGTVGIYNGDTEIEFFEAEMVQVISPSTGEVAALPFSTHDAALEANQGWLGVITGTVTSKTGSDTLIVNDGSGPVRVFLDGYNGDFDDIHVNDWVRVTGLLSEDGDGGRIRVRNYQMHTPQYPDDVVRWAPLAVTGFDLQKSLDQSTWDAVSGSWGAGYTLQLDPSVPFQYLNLENLLSNRPLKDGYYPFHVDTYPSGWFAYWVGRGVVSGASGWQGWMWQIINGNQPIFYLKVTNNGGSFMLVDGLTRDYFSVDTYLRVDGTYLAGAYTFQGTVNDTLGAPFELAVDIDFLARYYFPIVLSNKTP
jgi:uncharacterized protein YdeI (BOF family)